MTPCSNGAQASRQRKLAKFKSQIAIAIAGTLVLAACTDPNQVDGSPTLSKTQQGALIGAGTGALAGALIREDGKRDQGALVGAVVGGAVGAGIGYNLDQQEKDLRRDIGNQDVQITNTGDRLIVTMPQDLLFATDSSSVRPDLQRDLRAVSGNLQQYPSSTIQIIGHTDSDGAADYNQRLSEQRASAVGYVLTDAGVPSGRIDSFGRGESQPVASNLSDAGKAKNRRVDIVILPNA